MRFEELMTGAPRFETAADRRELKLCQPLGDEVRRLLGRSSLELLGLGLTTEPHGTGKPLSFSEDRDSPGVFRLYGSEGHEAVARLETRWASDSLTLQLETEGPLALVLRDSPELPLLVALKPGGEGAWCLSSLSNLSKRADADAVGSVLWCPAYRIFVSGEPIQQRSLERMDAPAWEAKSGTILRVEFGPSSIDPALPAISLEALGVAMSGDLLPHFHGLRPGKQQGLRHAEVPRTLTRLRELISELALAGLAGKGAAWPELALEANLDGPDRMTCDAAQGAFQLAPFVTLLEARNREEGTYPASQFGHFLGPYRTQHEFALAFRMALLPFHAHLICRALAKGQTPARHAALTPEIYLDEEAQSAPPHLLLGGELLVAADLRPPGSALPRLYLPPGEWIAYDSGARWKGGQTVTLGKTEPSSEGRAPLLVRAGAIIPMFDLSIRSPVPTDDPLMAGPPERILLKLFPLGERTERFFDIFAMRPLPEELNRESIPLIPVLEVGYRLDFGGLAIRLEGSSRPVILMIRSHRPRQISAGTHPDYLMPLAQIESERDFDRVTDCWMYHPHRDETFIKLRMEVRVSTHIQMDFEV